MKRFAVFDNVTYYPSGGLGDLKGAWDTEDEAVRYLEFLAVDDPTGDYYIEDMDKAGNDSPPVPTREEIAALREKKKQEREARLAARTPLEVEMDNAMARSLHAMQRCMFGDGLKEDVSVPSNTIYILPDKMPGLESLVKKDTEE